jgi:hypothetical protein
MPSCISLAKLDHKAGSRCCLKIMMLGSQVAINQSNAQETYIQLNALLAAAPELSAVDGYGGIPDVSLKWLAEVAATVSRLGLLNENAELNVAISMLISSCGGRAHSAKIKIILYRCIALAQQASPSTAQSAFVASGSDFDAFAAIQRVIQQAQSSILIVDPYLDETALLSFGVLANEKVSLALLADENGLRLGLKPAADRWLAQYQSDRPLTVKLAAKRTLHDRLILVDSTEAWILTQSLKDFAARSPATIQKVDPILARMKFEAYSDVWKASVTLVG